MERLFQRQLLDLHNILSNVEITVSEVISELKNINPTKSSGYDNIPGILLKNTAKAIVFNMSLSLGHVPIYMEKS